MRRAGPLALALGIIVLCVAGAIALTGGSHRAGSPATASAARPPAGGSAALESGTAPVPLGVRLSDPDDPVRMRFKHEPRAGLLFDIDTGKVLWRRAPTRELPIASLTKMMTALVVTDHVGRHAKVPITRLALRYQGSGVGMFRRGRRIPVRTMLYGLLLPSGNDAARALAQRTAGSLQRFVAMMNDRAASMGLRCTHYTSPDGFVDRGNHSCAADLAVLARAVLDDRRLAPIVRSEHAVLRFPTKGGKLYLYNNNPLLRNRYRGVTGLKTGYTEKAGLCIVATARRGPVSLGVVLLHSPNWDTQARRLLDAGFRSELAR